MVANIRGSPGGWELAQERVSSRDRKTNPKIDLREIYKQPANHKLSRNGFETLYKLHLYDRKATADEINQPKNLFNIKRRRVAQLRKA